MKKIVSLFLLLIINVSCGSIKEREDKDDEKLQDLKYIDYNFWSFNGNGNNSNKEKPSWITQRIEFSDNSLISDGIYENSGRFKSETAYVNDSYSNNNKGSVAIKFKFRKGYPKRNTVLPIIVRGKYYRNLRIQATSKKTIKIIVSGSNIFALPNEDINMNKIFYKSDSYNKLYVSWDIEKHLFYIAINNEAPQTIKIPKDFEWDKKENIWTIQDYSNGSAFKGELDYFLTTNSFNNRKTMNELLKKN